MIWLDAHLTCYPITPYLSGCPVREYFQWGVAPDLQMSSPDTVAATNKCFRKATSPARAFP
jgi:hypothetical protein